LAAGQICLQCHFRGAVQAQVPPLAGLLFSDRYLDIFLNSSIHWAIPQIEQIRCSQVRVDPNNENCIVPQISPVKVILQLVDLTLCPQWLDNKVAFWNILSFWPSNWTTALFDLWLHDSSPWNDYLQLSGAVKIYREKMLTRKMSGMIAGVLICQRRKALSISYDRKSG
jgi:hypothetical protein